MKKIFVRFLGCLFLLLLVSCEPPAKLPPATEGSSPICVLNTADNHRLQGFIQILADSETGYSIEDIVQPGQQNRFVAFPDKGFEPQSHQTYWGKIQLENRLPEAEMQSEWVLDFSSTFTSLTLYRPTENGTWNSEVNGSFVPAHQKSFVPTQDGNLFKLVLPPGKVVTLYFRGASERSSLPPTFHAYLQPLDVFYDKLVAAKSSDGLFAGFLLMMLLYNLLKFFFVRDRSYIYYAGYLLMVAIFTSFNSEDLMDWFGGFVFADHPAYHNLFKSSHFLGLMCYLAFIRSFLDLEHLLPKWDRFFRYVIWLGVPMMVLFVFLSFRYNFSYDINDRPILAYIALVSISGFIFIYPLFKTKDPKGFFITAGIAVISLGFLLTLHSRMTETPFTVFYLKVAAIVEFLIFSMGLAYRERQQEVAKQQADFALRESRLIQEKNQVETDRLQELNDFKSRFFTNITHEFRTPLTVILGMAEQLKKEGGRLTEDARNGILMIKRSGENLLRLVNQILDLAKLESNTLKINYVQGDVATYLKYIAESLHSLSNAQNLMLKVESVPASIVMDYDPERFLQIIHNLLSNAIKFTPSGGKVLLRADLKDKWLHISVSDSGAGIPPEELPQLFERFFQAKNQEHAKAGGTGIGLSLTRELVKAMGGEISVESTVGVGSTFLVKLPITNSSVLEEKSSNQHLEGWKAILPTTNLPNKNLSATGKNPAEDSPNPHILLIEDNPDVVEYLTACLVGATLVVARGEGDHEGRPHGRPYVLDFAYNGQAGIEKALETVPDLIVSDVMMPIKDGFEVVETLKNDERTSHIPIILLTAKADVQSRLTGLRRGADAYLSKPFHQEELLVTLENLLESRRKLQLKYQQNVLATDAPKVPEADPEDSFLLKVRAIVEKNLSDADFEMPQLERALGMSRSQIFRKIKALTGKSPSLFIRSVRLYHGKQMLLSTSLTVSEIAYEVGFTSLNYFSDAFLEEFGERPMKARG